MVIQLQRKSDRLEKLYEAQGTHGQATSDPTLSLIYVIRCIARSLNNSIIYIPNDLITFMPFCEACAAIPIVPTLESWRLISDGNLTFDNC